MSKSNFSSQIAWNKAESLRFGIKNAHVATPSLVQRYGAGAQQFQTKNFQQKNNFLCLRLLVCVVRKLQHYKRMAYVLSNHFSTQTFVVEL